MTIIIRRGVQSISWSLYINNILQPLETNKKKNTNYYLNIITHNKQQQQLIVVGLFKSDLYLLFF